MPEIAQRGYFRLDLADKCNIRCIICQADDSLPVSAMNCLDFDTFVASRAVTKNPPGVRRVPLVGVPLPAGSPSRVNHFREFAGVAWAARLRGVLLTAVERTTVYA